MKSIFPCLSSADLDDPTLERLQVNCRNHGELIIGSRKELYLFEQVEDAWRARYTHVAPNIPKYCKSIVNISILEVQLGQVNMCANDSRLVRYSGGIVAGLLSSLKLLIELRLYFSKLALFLSLAYHL